MSEEIPICDRCGSSCERGHSERWRGEERVSVHCLGCAQALRLAKYAEDRRLSLLLIEYAQLGAPSEYRGASWEDPIEARICDSARRLHEDVLAFERAVWFAGAQRQARAARKRGTSADLGDGLKLLCWTMCGRAMLTIDGPTDSVTVITEEEGTALGRMGLRGIDATEEAARKLLRDAIAAWGRGAELREDGQVSYP